MYRVLFFVGLFCLSGAGGFAEASEVPVGFEGAGVLKDVMAGKVVSEEKVSTNREFKTVFRAFVRKASPDAYVELFTNHKRYPSLFREIRSAKTTKANTDRTEFEYWMDISIKVGIFSHHVYPEGRQVYFRPRDAVSEGLVFHQINNYKEHLQKAEEVIRLIPYEDGILIEDTIHVVLHTANSQSGVMKSHLKQQYQRILVTMRNELQGN